MIKSSNLIQVFSSPRQSIVLLVSHHFQCFPMISACLKSQTLIHSIEAFRDELRVPVEVLLAFKATCFVHQVHRFLVSKVSRLVHRVHFSIIVSSNVLLLCLKYFVIGQRELRVC